MKKQGFILLLFLSSVSLSSCQVVLRTIFGAKKVKPKTTEEVVQAAEKYQLVGGELAALSYSGYLETFNVDYFKSLVHYEIFNRDGFSVIRDSSEYSACASSATKVLAELKNPEKSKVVENFHINTMENRLRALDGGPLTLSSPPSEYDFTVFIFWASYAGRFNKPIVEWLEAIHQMEDLKVLVVFVSADQRAWWEEPEAEGVAAQ